MRKLPASLIVLVLSAAPALADVRVSNLFGENMVLQREIAAPVWGEADPGENVTVKIGDATVSGAADAHGKWSVKLPAMKAESKPQELTISGKNTIAIKNVLVGDVWVCSGQSNMEMNLGECNAPEDVASAKFPTIRRIKFDHIAIGQPQSRVPGHWEVCTPESSRGFTAVGFYFAKRIQKEVGVPIGLVDDNWGGTRIEPWIPLATFETEPALSASLTDLNNRVKSYRDGVRTNLDAIEKWVKEARSAIASDGTIPPQPQLPGDPLTDAGVPTSIYNGMIAPLAPYGIKGAIWYQGESNGGEGDEYVDKMRGLIGGWRKVWNQGDFPFYFVQIANFTGATEDPGDANGWPKTRMAQFDSLKIPHTGMAVIIDIGEANDIHPKDKFDVGERLALWALRNEYRQKDLVVSGPLYKSMAVEDGKIRVKFDSVGTGLIVGKKDGRTPTIEDKGGKLKRFAIAGEDKKWHWADAVIDGGDVIVSSPEVPKPAAVRYAFTMNPTGCNLYNKEGLPASPFRTDKW